VTTYQDSQSGIVLEDTNGNQIRCGTDCVDTVGRHFILNATSNNLTNTITYPDATPGNPQITIASTSYQVAFFALDEPPGQCDTATDPHPGTLTQGCAYHYTYTAPLPTSLTLPGGATYSFEYSMNPDGSTTGELSKITFPGGGYVRYVYAGGCGEARGVSDRYVSPDGTAQSEQHWTYAANRSCPTFTGGASNDGPTLAITTTKPSPGETTIDTFQNSDAITSASAFSVPVSPLLLKEQEFDSSNNALRTTDNTPGYDNTTFNVGGIYSADYYNNPRIASQLITLNDTGQKAATTYSYSPFGNVQTTFKYDWGPTGTDTLLSRTVNSYWVDSHPDYGTSYNLLDRLASTAIYDSTSDTCYGQSMPCSMTTYGYDESALQDTSNANAVMHDYAQFPSSVVNRRGNLTSINSFLNTTNSYLSTTHSFDDLGNIVAVTDPLQNQTTYSYADSYYNFAPSQPTLAHVTTVSLPSSLSRKYQYDYQSGNVAASCGFNFSGTCVAQLSGLHADYSTTSYDGLGRPLCQNTGDGGSTCLIYHDQAPLSVSQTVLQNPNPSITRGVTFDGLGRTSVTTLDSDPQGTTYTKTSYDNHGRVYQQWNPSRCIPSSTPCGSETTWGITTLGYDSLDRKQTQTNPDGSALGWSYSGNSVNSSDEASNHTIRTTDALGRLSNVTEASGATTFYYFDAGGNLRRVSQPGVPSEVARPDRMFAYDSMGRLQASSNPETSTSGISCSGVAGSSWGNCYTYDANGNLLTKTDARGVTTSYVYDALNRLCNKNYSDGVTPNEVYWYDYAPAWMADLQNVLGRLANSANVYGGSTTGQPATAAAFSYNTVGRVVRKWQQVPSTSAAGLFMYAGYDLAGNMTSLTYPSGLQIANAYDAAGRLSTVSQGGFQYVSSVNYAPNGAPTSTSYGDGVTETTTLNSRFQPCESSVTKGSSSFIDRQYFYGINNTSGQQCSPVSSNNGNIWNIVDGLGGSYTQMFQYDSLNRLKSWTAPNMASAYQHLDFVYDSFGNMVQAANGASVNVSNVYNSSNQYAASQFNCLGASGQQGGYDAAGNVLCSGTQNVDAKAFTWDAESRLAQVGMMQNNNTYNLTGTYLYDESGDRVRADTGNGNWREYFRFGGNVLTERVQDGSLTDYLYANGKRFARIDNATTAAPSNTITVRFTNDSCSECAGQSPYEDRNLYVTGLTVGGVAIDLSQATYNNCHIGGELQCTGDLTVTTSQTGGVVVTAYGSPDYGVDPDMQILINGTLVGDFDVPPTSATYAAGNQTTVDLRFTNDSCSECTGNPSGGDTNFYVTAISVGDTALDLSQATYTGCHWFQWFNCDGDMVMTTSSTGQVEVYGYGTSDQGVFPHIQVYVNGAAQGSFDVAPTPTAYGPFGTSNGSQIHYMVSDHLKTALMEFDAYGIPTWTGYFAPFGQELDDPVTSTNHYKFTGKERDAESGLDYFGARYYSSNMGRFSSPDPSGLAYADFTNPQSLNLYSYVLNNPLRFVDPTGLYCAWEDGTSDDDPSDGGAGEGDCNSQGGHWTDQSNPCHGADGCVATFDWNQPQTQDVSFTGLIGGSVNATSISLAGLQFTAGCESFRGKAYNDSNGNCTVGYGHLMHMGACSASELAQGAISRQTGLAMLNQDMSGAVAAVNNQVNVDLTQNQFDAMADFTFNVGAGGLQKSAALQDVNSGNTDQVGGDFGHFHRGGKGIPARRANEAAMFNGQGYAPACYKN
jgi:RHS repeat-associated protein